MKKSQAYVKFMIKNSFLYYTFLGLFVAVFILMALWIKIDIVETHSAYISGNHLTVNSESIAFDKNKVYIYKNKNEKVYQANIEESVTSQECILNTNFSGVLEGPVTIDVVTGQQTLLECIFVKAGNNYE